MRNSWSPAYQKFLRKIVAARQARGLTQVQVSKALGWPQSRISKMERGERRMDVLEADALARLYKRPLSWFLRDTS